MVRRIAQDVQACPSCGRTWGRRAAFCGACGDRLSASLLARAIDSSPGPRVGQSWWRRPATSWSALTVVVMAAVIAVPTMLRGSGAVVGDVGVPDPDDLVPIASDDPRAPPPAQPGIACTRDGQPRECVSWMHYVPSRGVGFDAASTGGAVIVSWDRGFGETGVLALDAETGTQRWTVRLEGVLRGVEVRGGVARIATHQAVSVLAVATGEIQWESSSTDMLSGILLGDRHVYTHALERSSGQRGHTLQARSIIDGSLAWEWTSSDLALSDHLHLQPLPDNRLLVHSFGRVAVALDSGTGEVLWTTSEGGHDWFALDNAVLGMRSPDTDPAGPNPAGDPGAVITTLNIEDGSTRWQRTIRARDVSLGVTPDLVTAPSTGRLAAIDVISGEPRWEVKTDEREHAASVLGLFDARGRLPTSDLVVTVGERSGWIRGRSAESGSLVWEHEPAGPGGGFPYAIVSSGHVRVADERSLVYLDLETGQEVLEVTGGALSPVVRDPSLAVAPRGYLVRFQVPGSD